jgi:hypothetical protein
LAADCPFQFTLHLFLFYHTQVITLATISFTWIAW